MGGGGEEVKELLFPSACFFKMDGGTFRFTIYLIRLGGIIS